MGRKGGLRKRLLGIPRVRGPEGPGAVQQSPAGAAKRGAGWSVPEKMVPKGSALKWKEQKGCCIAYGAKSGLATFAGKKQKLGPVFSQGVRSSSHKSLTLAVMALSLGGTWSLSG